MSSYREDTNTFVKEARWTFWKILGLVLLIGIVVSSIGFVLRIASRPAEVIDKVTNADRIIFNYELFFDTYNDTLAMDKQIQNTVKQISNLEESLGPDRANWAREDKTEWNRLNSVLLGLRTQRDSVVADYNSKSKQLTRNLFKDRSLPYSLAVVDDVTVPTY